MTILVTLWCAVLGAVFGSGILCACERWLAGKSWLTGRSCCDACGHPLGALDLIPIVSYLACRGRCRHCGAAIPVRALVFEVASAAAFGVVGWHFGLSLALAQWVIFVVLLLAVSAIDLQVRLIPNTLLVLAAVNRLLWMVVTQEPQPATLITMGQSLIVPVALLVIILVFERIRGAEAMGGGDVKLLMVMALYLNWMSLILALMVACIVGIVAAGAKLTKTIPFGPALAAGCILSATLLQPLVNVYASLL